MDALKADPRGADHSRRFSAWLADNGVAEADSTLFVGLPRRSRVLIPRALQPHAERVDPGASPSWARASEKLPPRR